MSSTQGRAIRIIAGAALIAAGLLSAGTGAIIIAIVGVVPLAAGAANVCLLAPLFGADLAGHKRTAR